MFSKKLNRTQAENRLSRLRQSAAGHTDLTQANPTQAALPWDPEIEACLRRARADCYAPDPRGSTRACEAVATSIGADPSQLLLSASTSEAYTHVFRVLCDPGDVVAIPRPGYPLVEHLARLCDLSTVFYDLHYDGEWFIDIDSLRQASQVARVIAATSPNNPTGSYLSDAELAFLGSLGLPVIVDEVFYSYPLEREPGSRGRSCPAPLVFSLGGISKELALPQLKLSWVEVAGEQPLAQTALNMLDFVADQFLSCNTIALEALPELLTVAQPRKRLIQRRLRENLDALQHSLKAAPCTVRTVAGGWYAVLQLPSSRTDEAWSEAFLRRAQAWVYPGYFFDAPTTGLGCSEALVIVSLLCQPDQFRSAAGRLATTICDLA